MANSYVQNDPFARVQAPRLEPPTPSASRTNLNAMSDRIALDQRNAARAERAAGEPAESVRSGTAQRSLSPFDPQSASAFTRNQAMQYRLDQSSAYNRLQKVPGVGAVIQPPPIEEPAQQPRSVAGPGGVDTIAPNVQTKDQSLAAADQRKLDDVFNRKVELSNETAGLNTVEQYQEWAQRTAQRYGLDRNQAYELERAFVPPRLQREYETVDQVKGERFLQTQREGALQGTAAEGVLYVTPEGKYQRKPAADLTKEERESADRLERANRFARSRMPGRELLVDAGASDAEKASLKAGAKQVGLKDDDVEEMLKASTFGETLDEAEGNKVVESGAGSYNNIKSGEAGSVEWDDSKSRAMVAAEIAAKVRAGTGLDEAVSEVMRENFTEGTLVTSGKQSYLGVYRDLRSEAIKAMKTKGGETAQKIDSLNNEAIMQADEMAAGNAERYAKSLDTDDKMVAVLARSTVGQDALNAIRNGTYDVASVDSYKQAGDIAAEIMLKERGIDVNARNLDAMRESIGGAIVSLNSNTAEGGEVRSTMQGLAAEYDTLRSAVQRGVQIETDRYRGIAEEKNRQAAEVVQKYKDQFEVVRAGKPMRITVPAKGAKIAGATTFNPEANEQIDINQDFFMQASPEEVERVANSFLDQIVSKGLPRSAYNEVITEWNSMKQFMDQKNQEEISALTLPLLSEATKASGALPESSGKQKAMARATIPENDVALATAREEEGGGMMGVNTAGGRLQEPSPSKPENKGGTQPEAIAPITLSPEGEQEFQRITTQPDLKRSVDRKILSGVVDELEKATGVSLDFGIFNSAERILDNPDQFASYVSRKYDISTERAQELIDRIQAKQQEAVLGGIRSGLSGREKGIETARSLAPDSAFDLDELLGSMSSKASTKASSKKRQIEEGLAKIQ